MSLLFHLYLISNSNVPTVSNISGKHSPNTFKGTVYLITPLCIWRDN